MDKFAKVSAALAASLMALATTAFCGAEKPKDSIRATLTMDPGRPGWFVMHVTNMATATVRFLDVHESASSADLYEVAIKKNGRTYESKGMNGYAAAGDPRMVELAPGQTYDRDIQPLAYVTEGRKVMIPPYEISVTYRLTQRILERWERRRGPADKPDLRLTFRTTLKVETANREPKPEGGRGVLPYVTISGADSKVRQRGYFRVGSEKEWVKVWQRHKGEKESEQYNLFYNPLGLPLVDFRQCMVIAVFEGASENNAGLRASSVTDEKDRVLLRFQDNGFQTVNGGRPSTAYGFFVLPRSNKPVVLEEDVRHLINGPPVWKEQARLPPPDSICLGMAFSDATAVLKAAGYKEIIPTPFHGFGPVQPGDEFQPLTLDELKPWRQRMQGFAAPAPAQAKKK